MLTLYGKEPDVVEKAKRRRLDILLTDLASHHYPRLRMDPLLERGQLNRACSGWSGDTHSSSTGQMCLCDKWKPVSGSVGLIRLKLEQVGVLAVDHVYRLNNESNHDAFLEEVDGTLKRFRTATMFTWSGTSSTSRRGCRLMGDMETRCTIASAMLLPFCR